MAVRLAAGCPCSFASRGDEPGWEVRRYPTTDGTVDVPRYSARRQLQGSRKRAVPRWEGEQLEELMLDRFLIVENDDKVKLALSPGHSSWDITKTVVVSDEAV